MSKYTVEVKLQAVARYLTGNESYKIIAESIGTEKSQVINWVKLFKKVELFSSDAGKITNKIKTQVIFELKEQYEVVDLAEVADIPRSTYYYWEKRLNQVDKYEAVKEAIKIIYHEHKGRYGYRLITKELKKYGFTHDPKTINRLMNEIGLKCRVRIKKYRSYKGNVGKIAPNVLQRDFKSDKMNQKWVTEVT